MNKHFEYPTRYLWNRDAWDCKLSPTQLLARWMAKEGLMKVDYPRIHTKENTPDNLPFSVRMSSYEDAATHKAWEEQGMFLQFGHAGENWVTFTPRCVIEQKEHDPVTLFVLVDFDYSQPYWGLDFSDYYKPYFEMAQKEGIMLCFVNSVPNRVDLCILILREMSQRYNVNHSRLYMDLSALKKHGRSLSEVPDFKLRGADGAILPNPDEAIEFFGSLKLPVINITGQWVSNDSLEFANFTPGRIGTVPFDYDRLAHSISGQKTADAMALEFDYDTGEDAGLQQLIANMGLHYGYYEMNNRGWFCIAPQSAFDHPEAKIPCMLVLQEVCKSDPHSIPSAISLWFEYLNIAAMGDLMLIFFVLEDPDSNDLLTEILEEAKQRYPFLDSSRVYITGHSHNGHYSMEFARRHPRLIAGVGTMGNEPGLHYKRESVPCTDETFAYMSTYDMPIININGEWENPYSCAYLKPGDSRYHTDEEKVHAYQKRLQACRIPQRSPEEILAAANSENRAVRMLGVPVDSSEILYMDGDECYVGDLKNLDGNVHLRFVTIENLPHATCPQMPWLTWSFLRRFARDPETGRIIELDIRKK